MGTDSPGGSGEEQGPGDYGRSHPDGLERSQPGQEEGAPWTASGPRAAREAAHEEETRRRTARLNAYHADDAPQPRGNRARRTLSRLARDLSQSLSRGLRPLARGGAPTDQPTAASRTAYNPAFAASSAGLSAEALAQRHRRSRIRLRARKWRAQRRPPDPLQYFILLGGITLAVVTLMGASGAGMIYATNYYNQHLIQIQALAARLQNGHPTQILDRNGKVLYTATDQSSEFSVYVPLAQINPLVRAATVDTEDSTFYSKLNIGIDFKSILRAGASDVQAGGAAQGASTITQQLVKNMVLEDQSKVFQRKINEAILAVGLTLNYTKDQILEMYLNSIDYGNLNQGIEAAAQNFFGKIPYTDPKTGTEVFANQQLDLAQIAILAGLPNAPTYYMPAQFSCAKASCPDSTWDNPCTNNPTDAGCTPNGNYCDQATRTCSHDGHEWLVWRRARYVLQKMVTQGDISNGQYTKALGEVHDILQSHRVYVQAGPQGAGNVTDLNKLSPTFIDYVIHDVLPHDFGIDTDVLPHAGLKIYTTLDYNLDVQAQHLLTYYIEGDPAKGNTFTNYWYCGTANHIPPVGGCQETGLAAESNVHNGSVVAIDPHTGDVLAMVGTVKYGDPDKQVLGYNNIAISDSRSMGSSTKPLVYATAFQMGWYPGIMLQDSPICFPTQAPDPNPYAPACKGWYSPTNYEDFSFSGYGPIREMLANSLNIPATEVMSFVGDGASETGSANVLAMARRLGVTSLSAPNMGPATALGAQDIPLLQLSGAYATFADAGVRHPYRSILRIENSAGNVLYQAHSAPQGEQVLSPQTAYMLTSILTDNSARLPDFGWYNPLNFACYTGNVQGQCVVPDHPGYEIAAKTGTSQGQYGPNDIVTMGYSPYLALGVWFGNTDAPDPLAPGIIGIAGAGYVFHDIMDWAIDHYHWPQGTSFPIPAGMAMGQFNCLTGLAPYKGQTPANCQFQPAIKPKNGLSATNIYAGWQYRGGTQAPDLDWYVQGQAPLQS
jgi:membrane peptidoglycan carboxypeptidase